MLHSDLNSLRNVLTAIKDKPDICISYQGLKFLRWEDDANGTIKFAYTDSAIKDYLYVRCAGHILVVNKYPEDIDKTFTEHEKQYYHNCKSVPTIWLNPLKDLMFNFGMFEDDVPPDFFEASVKPVIIVTWWELQ